MKKISKNEITAVILAGGQASRMDGEDKGLIVFRELPLISHVINITKPKVSQILISANRNFEEYANFGKVISDDLEGYQGPLAGISKALKVCSTRRSQGRPRGRGTVRPWHTQKPEANEPYPKNVGQNYS